MAGAEVCTFDLEQVYPLGGSRVHALRGVDITVPAGQFVVVRGSSGSGKTTLFHALAGLERPTRGRIRIGETELQTLASSDADRFRRRHIGLVFQFFNLIPSLTVEMNVALPLLLDGRRLPALRDRVGEICDRLRIGHRRSHSPHQLSGGEMQRVAIARALIVDPKVLLADEPTGNLDSRTAHDVFGLLREQAHEHGATTIVMTHEPGATAYADRVIEMRDGRIASDGAESVAVPLARSA
jgi:putative ABC transport system ATP-binding protein